LRYDARIIVKPPPDQTIESAGEARLPSSLKPLSPRPHLFIALECDRPMAGPTRHALASCDEVLIGRGPERAFVRAGRRLELAIPDSRMSAAHARIHRDGERWLITDLDSRNGMFVNGARTKAAELADGDLCRLGHTLLLFAAALPATNDPPFDVDAAELAGAPPGTETLLPRLGNDFAVLSRMAAGRLPILVEGATGTGKELLARAIHQLARRKGPLVAVNCGALPPNLVESELFGHVRGAFSGAVQDRPGLVRAAHGGTLFLDEIGELPLSAQVTFLRVLQERQVTAIGASQPVAVDIVIVSATNRDLTGLVEQERFRSDLFARLAGFRIKLPSLAERRPDIGFMLRAFLAQSGRTNVTFSPTAAERLLRHAWTLNVRELEHALRSALALALDEHIDVPHLPAALQVDAEPAPPLPVLDAAEQELRAQLTALLTQHGGNIAEVARAMGKRRTQIHRWVNRFKIDLEALRR
jgi:transcriptional regulator of acetoin/glycerol metabolism